MSDPLKITSVSADESHVPRNMIGDATKGGMMYEDADVGDLLAFTGPAGLTIAGVTFGLWAVVAVAVAMIFVGLLMYRWAS